MTVLPVDVDGIPAALKAIPQWAPWRAVPKANGKADKVPHRADAPSAMASTKESWWGFDAAVKASANLSGIGLNIKREADITSTDLDGCVTLAGDGTVTIAPWADEIIGKAATYTEVSPSKTGIRMFHRGRCDDWTSDRTDGKPGIEIYAGNSPRFVTVTGQRIEGAPETVNAAPPGFMDWMAGKYRRAPKAEHARADMPAVIEDASVPEGLPADAALFLASGDFEGGDRSAFLARVARALYSVHAGEDRDARVLSILAGNDHAMQIALEHRNGRRDKAIAYLWDHHCIPARSAGLNVADFPAPVQTEAPQRAPVAQAVAGALGRRLPSMADVLTRRTERRPYLIKGVLLAGTYAEIFGASGEGKTFLALDIAHCIGGGERATWHGRPVAQGPVLYLALEGAGGLGERLQALAQEFGPARDLYVADGGRYDLCSPVGREALGADIAATFGDRKPVLIVVDTLARALALSGRDENSAQDIGLLNAAVGGLIAATGATALVIHHSGKDKSKGARGSSALYAALDTELEIGGGHVEATKQRDLAEGPVLDFKLKPVAVGADADGDPVTSCVIEEAAGRARAPWKPSGQVADAMRALCHLKPDNAPLTEEEWKAGFVAEAWPVAAPPAKDTQDRQFRRAVKALREAGQVESTPDGWRRTLR